MLRDQLPPAEAVQLGAQLPMLVRGLFYEGWRPSRYRDERDRWGEPPRRAPRWEDERR